jgi:hypothetical protein
VDKASGRRLQSKGPEPRRTLSVNGRVSLWRQRLYLESQGSRSPLDVLVDAAEATVSVGVGDLCCRLNGNGNGKSFDRAAENLQKAAQVKRSGEKLREVVEAEGKRALALAKSGALGPDWLAKDCKVVSPQGREVWRVYLGSDGFMTPLVTDAQKPKRRTKVKEKRQKRGRKAKPLPQARKGADGPWKEFKGVLFYDQSMEHRRVSVTKGKCQEAGKLMQRDAGRPGFSAADERVGNMDGGPWIMGQIEVRRMPMTATGLDFFHLSKNAHKSRRILFGEEDEAGKQRAAELLHTVKHEGYQPFWEDLLELWKQSRGQAQRQEADRLLHDVAERKQMILCPEFLAKGWQIGSGPTESQCRVLPDRVKGVGMRWDGDNAQALMALEALRQSNQWDTYWRMALYQQN